MWSWYGWVDFHDNITFNMLVSMVTINCFSSFHCSLLHPSGNSSTDTGTQEVEMRVGSHDTLQDCIGEDADVVIMQTEDDIMKECDGESGPKYPYEYLLNCRKELMMRVKEYRAIVEDQKSRIIAMEYKHRKEIERIRSFYQGIAYAPTRTGKIYKRSHCSSSIAKQILKDVGLKYGDHK